MRGCIGYNWCRIRAGLMVFLLILMRFGRSLLYENGFCRHAAADGNRHILGSIRHKAERNSASDKDCQQDQHHKGKMHIGAALHC